MESIFQENQVSKPIAIPKNLNNSNVIYDNNEYIFDNEYILLNDNNNIQLKDNNIPYSLKENFFDPNKSSPPNFWSNRLLDRFQNY